MLRAIPIDGVPIIRRIGVRTLRGRQMSGPGRDFSAAITAEWHRIILWLSQKQVFYIIPEQIGRAHV